MTFAQNLRAVRDQGEGGSRQGEQLVQKCRGSSSLARLRDHTGLCVWRIAHERETVVEKVGR